MPNSCAVLATQAYLRLGDANWRAILSIRYIDPVHSFGLGSQGHMLLIWQPWEGGNILAYDATGTTELDTKSHELKPITEELMTKNHIVIFEAHFL